MLIGDAANRLPENLDRRFWNMLVVVRRARCSKILQEPWCLKQEPDLAKAIELLNDRVNRSDDSRFVTLVVFVITANGRDAKVVNAGHAQPVILRAKNATTEVMGYDTTGLPLAIAPHINYETTQLCLQAGDVAVLYTDGISEAENSQHEIFGLESIRRKLMQGGDAKMIRNRIKHAILDHVGSRDREVSEAAFRAVDVSYRGALGLLDPERRCSQSAGHRGVHLSGGPSSARWPASFYAG